MNTFYLTVMAISLVLIGFQATAKDYKHVSKHNSEYINVSDHHIFNTDIVISGATILTRDFSHRVVTASIYNNALTPSTAYTVWWAIFNKPQHCIEPFSCGVQDLEIFGGNPRVHVSVFYGGGLLSDSSGSGNALVNLSPGRTNRELFAESKNYGLQNLKGAEIHVVLRSHGEVGEDCNISGRQIFN